MANVTIGTNLRQRQNAGDADATGVEIDGEIRPAARLRVGASAVLTDATFQNSLEPVLEGKRLPQVPRRSFALLADATVWRSIIVSGILRSTSSQFDDDRNQFELAPATQVDLRVAGRERRVRLVSGDRERRRRADRSRPDAARHAGAGSGGEGGDQLAEVVDDLIADARRI